jgi:hypothetical protein
MASVQIARANDVRELTIDLRLDCFHALRNCCGKHLCGLVAIAEVDR